MLIQRAFNELTLMLQLKHIILEKTNEIFCFKKNGYAKKQKKQFSRISGDETKNGLIRRKEKQLSQVLWS